MTQLIFKRRKREPIVSTGQMVVKIDVESYNKVLEIADESGESLRSVVSKMVEYAYEQARFESDSE